jgi:hypothetical protein
MHPSRLSGRPLGDDRDTGHNEAGRAHSWPAGLVLFHASAIDLNDRGRSSHRAAPRRHLDDLPPRSAPLPPRRSARPPRRGGGTPGPPRREPASRAGPAAPPGPSFHTPSISARRRNRARTPPSSAAQLRKARAAFAGQLTGAAISGDNLGESRIFDIWRHQEDTLQRARCAPTRENSGATFYR